MESVQLPTNLHLDRKICGELHLVESREILITNGIGGYGSLTLANSLTRSYHGLLIAALRPPLGRTLLLSKLNETVTYLDQEHHLFTERQISRDFGNHTTAQASAESAPPPLNQSGQSCTCAGERLETSISEGSFLSDTARGTINADQGHPEALIPAGFKHLESFHLEGTVPVFRYSFGDAVLEKKIWMKRGQNTVYATYFLQRASQAIRLHINALANYRNHHFRTSATEPHFSHSVDIGSDKSSVAIRFTTDNQQTTLDMFISDGHFELANNWITGFLLREERARGLLELDDHLHAAAFMVELQPGRQVTFVATAEGNVSQISLDGEVELSMHHDYEKQLLKQFENARMASNRRKCKVHEGCSKEKQLSSLGSSPTSGISETNLKEDIESNVRQLVLAADQFIISRGVGYSVIAGFHWFTDWARDTMISLPGLTIATGRYEIARSIMQTFSRHVSEGMLPNKFPDDGSAPTENDYNNVDGTLWFFEAVRSYLIATDDTEFLQELYPVLRQIIEYHCKGTRYGIKQDRDGLLTAGAEGLALTWMDAKSDVVHTQRDGKAVEVAALWFNALRCMSFFASKLGLEEGSHSFYKMAVTTEKSFQEKFWNTEDLYCYDVIDGGPNKNEKDSSLRPNQLIASSLCWSPLNEDQRALVLEACTKYLLTPNSIRSLSPVDKNYRGVYQGDVLSRDSSYHQGVGWAWLIGPFILTSLRVHGNKRMSRQCLLPLLKSHLTDAGIGQVSELFDSDPPFRAKGCVAQAWSVAELLRAWLATEPDESSLNPGEEV